MSRTNPKPKKSRPYLVDGERYSFSYKRNGELLGITRQNTNGKFNIAEDINNSKFTTSTAQDAIIDSYNKAKYGSTKSSYKTFADVEYASIEERNEFFDDNKRKFANQEIIQLDDNATTNIAPAQVKKQEPRKIMQYPFDLDPNQDHLKISRYNYVRPDLNMSKSAGRRVGEGVFSGITGRESNVTNSGQPIETVAGDSVVGSDFKSVILLPMPKVTDVNGVEWGKSELNSSGLTALNLTNIATFGGLASGKNKNEDEKLIREAIASRREPNSIREGAAALYTGTVAKLAGTLTGSDLDADTFLARQGGKVLNPNAEMLFQGPVIRDFGFTFVMIARNQEEGKMIRSIIRELKLGMAPKFRSTTFLENPDVFTLEYKNGPGKRDLLNTVNRFSPGGLALTTMRVDYAPDGYWAAYRDSQPVAVKMDLDFTELRPIYQGDQLGIEEDDHVGY